MAYIIHKRVKTAILMVNNTLCLRASHPASNEVAERVVQTFLTYKKMQEPLRHIN